MQPEYDFSKAKRAKNVPHLTKLRASMKGKTRITIMLDDDVIDVFRNLAEERGIGYQTAINEALSGSGWCRGCPRYCKNATGSSAQGTTLQIVLVSSDPQIVPRRPSEWLACR